MYQAAATCDSIRAVAYPTFTCLWHSLLPSIILMWAMTDLCWQCQKGSMVIQRSCGEVRCCTISTGASPIVQMERSVYTATCNYCAKSVKAHFQTNSFLSPPSPSSHIPPNSKPIQVHYNFDNAQQVCP